jgi:peptide-methionine (S)-S-oxide reductase
MQVRTRSRVMALLTFAGAVACTAASADAAMPARAVDVAPAAASSTQTVVFAGGCFWGIQAVFEHVKGVISATSGYAGGSVKDPDYEMVSSGTTGHAESVKIVFDPSRVTYQQLLQVFFSVAHDPTQLNRQGPDFGTQYRSAIFYTGDEQKHETEAYIKQLTDGKKFQNPIVTQVLPFHAFYAAEAYHQDYAMHNPNDPYIRFNDAPKVAHLKEKFADLYTDNVAHP